MAAIWFLNTLIAILLAKNDMQMLIYTPEVSNRQNYVFKFLLTQILGLSFALTSDLQEFAAYKGIKFSYTDRPLADEIFFKRYGLLQQDAIQAINPDTVAYQNYRACFAVTGSAMPFDVFSAAFFLLSRYEEYISFSGDDHNRYQAEQSFAYRNGFLLRPVIDEWAYEIARILQNRFPDLVINQRKVGFIPTIDIDRAYCWKYAPAWLNMAKLFKAVVTLNFTKFNRIIGVLAGKQPDPFDTYELMQNLHKGFSPVYFFLLANWSERDPSLSFRHPAMIKLIRQVSAYADAGIHPSYRTMEDPQLMRTEKSRLETITGKKAALSRQHFLRMKLPDTYRLLLENDITHDYTMVYASQPGFRASTCTPFYWYDLEKECETGLLLHPTAVMEATLKRYLKLNPDEALILLKKLADNVFSVGGTLCTLWHNESLTNQDRWKGWLTVYERLIQYIKERLDE
ncbi:hypothetical protein FW774_04550 (plasmid) [Pedobacter sp. BS3]|uniref:polysaccharide deacetylase family protein n=1 Tax=Pedobacter sp. BS3 TaxID=2567937 RepID=UPI0011EBC591|nr:polysaccharide deacetylase family protein [Pedobacter sp. BS3]TZF86323.1 hypothetical protein FW774_04550 [Pedobacter sp. BS3]